MAPRKEGEKGPGQNDEAVITRDVLLKTRVKRGWLGHNV